MRNTTDIFCKHKYGASIRETLYGKTGCLAIGLLNAIFSKLPLNFQWQLYVLYVQQEQSHFTHFLADMHPTVARGLQNEQAVLTAHRHVPCKVFRLMSINDRYRLIFFCLHQYVNVIHTHSIEKSRAISSSRQCSIFRTVALLQAWATWRLSAC